MAGRQDTFKHQGMRMQMCRMLRQKGISDERVLSAMEAVPRHWFMDTALESHAYEDKALPIDCGQTISQPSTVATQSQLLELVPGMKVLEVGTGSGYQTAVLCKMGVRVFSIERQKSLFDRTKRLLLDLRYSAKCFLGDGYQGLTEVNYGPYDRILVTCGAPFVPPALLGQLKVGGLMVVPIEDRMVRIRKTDAEPVVEEFGNCRFVPMLQGRQF